LRSGSLIERENYLRLSDVHAGSVDAHSYVRKSIAEGVRQAREHAGFTQAELAKKMGKSQTMVSQAESGAARISERYVTSVLKACGLPKDWVPKAKKRTNKR